MSSFDGRLRLPGQTKLPMGVVVDISDQRMKLTTGDRVLGDWPLDQVSGSAAPDGFHLELDGEPIVLNMVDPSRFAAELGVPEHVHRPPPPRRTHLGGPELAAEAASGPTNLVAGRLSGLVEDGKYEELRERVDKVADALVSDTVAPDVAFRQWVALLRELNQRHSGGSLPSNVFHRFNTELLDLISMPAPTRD